jgi:hypothetical protein
VIITGRTRPDLKYKRSKHARSYEELPGRQILPMPISWADTRITSLTPHTTRPQNRDPRAYTLAVLCFTVSIRDCSISLSEVTTPVNNGKITTEIASRRIDCAMIIDQVLIARHVHYFISAKGDITSS